MIYQNEIGKKFPKEQNKGHCRVCGGDLFGSDVVSIKHMSNAWTDENSIFDPDALCICEACQWLTTTNSHRSQIWHKNATMVVESDRTRTLSYYDFFRVLEKKDFTYPVLLAVHGKYKEALQKHIQWKSNRCVSHSSGNIRIAMSGMYVFDTGNRSMLDGIAQFDLNQWLPFVHAIIDKMGKDFLPYLPPKFTDRTKAHLMIVEILNALNASGQLNEATYLAAYLAGYSFFPESGKGVS